jgi:hypothetical protein
MAFRGTDRKSTTMVGEFVLHVDRDHRGNYRGSQAMDKKYRGWHYHVEHPSLTPGQVMDLIEQYLSKHYFKCDIAAKDLAVGFVESEPSRFSAWVECEDIKGTKLSSVLWLSAVTGSLHIEANKKRVFTKNLLSKDELIKIIKSFGHL